MDKRPMHIVVGGGSSGTALTLRLLETCDVLLISEGSDLDLALDPRIARADRWGAAAHTEHLGRSAETTLPDPSRGGRVQEYPRGVGLGGTSNINAMLCSAGSPSVFDDHWPYSWRAAALDPYLLLAEEMGMREVACRGGVFATIQALSLKEERRTSRSDLKSRLWERGAASYLGLFEGQKRRLLCHPLREAQSRGHLKVMWGVSAVRVLYRPGTNSVSGVLVRVSETGALRFVRRPAGGEVVLCAGVFETPKILARSQLFGSPLLIRSRKSCTYPVPPVRIDVGSAFSDHSVVPVTGLGIWWSPSGQSESKPVFPGNSVHGWIYLDCKGEVIQPGDVQSKPW